MGSFLQEEDQGWGQILQAGILPGKMLGQGNQTGARGGWVNHQAREIQCSEEETKEGRRLCSECHRDLQRPKPDLLSEPLRRRRHQDLWPYG